MTWPCTLRTDRLVLRPWREGDAEDLYRLASDPIVGSSCGWSAHQSLEESRRVLQRVLMVPDSWAICLLDDDAQGKKGTRDSGDTTLVGAISLSHEDRPGHPATDGEAWIGYWLGRPWWGQGLMPEAVREVMRHGFLDEGLDTIWAGVFSDNAQSVRVLDKAGFDSTGDDTYVDESGQAHEETLHRIAREQWKRALAADPGDQYTITHQQSEAMGIIDAMPLVSRVRTGGQTGADRGGLDAARACAVPICGWCPPGGLAEDLPEPPGVMAAYPELKEGAASGYVERTAWNVRDSHATLIVSPGGLEPKSGTEMTAVFARRFGRPVLVLDHADVDACAREALEWLESLGMRGITLNVAGPRESKMPGVYQLTKDVIEHLLRMSTGQAPQE
ncbi:MAG: GNAT family N-acetyltransferase [Atopobiaceae bacterium]